LLCHAEVPLAKKPNPDALAKLWLTARARPENEAPGNQPDSKEKFSSVEGTKLRTNHPMIKAALRALYEIWPESLPFEALAAKLGSSLAPMAIHSKELAEVMLQCYVGQFIELHGVIPHFVVEVSERPTGSPLARLQARAGARLTNLRHMTVNVYDLDRMVLSLLDGTRDMSALTNALEKAMAEGELELQQEGQVAPEGTPVGQILERELPVVLQRLARNALLVA
jgi:methyltransferase-like protein